MDYLGAVQTGLVVGQLHNESDCENPYLLIRDVNDSYNDKTFWDGERPIVYAELRHSSECEILYEY